MKITAIKSWLLRPAHHLAKGLQCGCPSKQEDYNSQGCSTNKRDEGAGQERLIFSTEVTWQSHKGWSNRKLQSLPNKAPTMTLPATASLSVWWGFKAPNQPSHCKNHSLALYSHKMKVVAGKTHYIPSSQKHSSGSGVTTVKGLWMPMREARAKFWHF